MEIIGLITARGGSKGIPRKNVVPLAGKPLIAWTIEAAFQSGVLSRVILSTDNDEIAETSRQFGAEVPFMRPAKLAEDTSDSLSVVEHAIHWLEEHEQVRPDYVLLLQPTSPLRTAEDICGAVELARARGTDVISVCETTIHPYLTMQLRADGTLAKFFPDAPEHARRQDLPRAYVVNGSIYLNRRLSLLQTRSFSPPDSIAYVMPNERSIDIDSPLDLKMAEGLLQQRMSGEHV